MILGRLKIPLHSIAFSDDAIKNLVPTDKTAHYWDKDEPGLLVTVNTGGTKTFYLNKTINNKTAHIKIGRFPDMTVDEARLDARAKKADIAAGINPRQVEKKIEKSVTIRGFANVKMRANSIASPEKRKNKLQLGDLLADGRVYAGISKEDSLAVVVAVADSADMYLSEAERYASKTKINGHLKARVGSKEDMRLLFKNRDKGFLKDSFKKSGSYKTSTPCTEGYRPNQCWHQSFAPGGKQESGGAYQAAHIRFVWHVKPSELRR